MHAELIEKYKDIIVRELNENLVALVLVGSFARNEGIDNVSDIEFLAVVKDMPSVEKICKAEGKLTIGLTTQRHLERLKPYIFAVETKKFGKVVWGDNGILNCIPNYSFQDIATQDGFTLLNNRIVEQLMLWQRIKRGESIILYDLMKGYIQMTNSILAFHQCYRALYPEKEEAISKLFEEKNNFSALFPGLLEKIHAAFILLKNGSIIKSIDSKEALEKWEELKIHMKNVWNYENHNMKGLSSLEILKDLARAIMVRGLPRFLIYRDALKEYFSDSPDEIRSADVVAKWEKYVK